MAARAVVRDVGRVYGMPYGYVDRIAKLIPFEIGMTLERALEESPDLKTAYETEEDVRTVIDMARQLEGLARNTGTHAGGVVIAPSPLTEFMPLYMEPEGALSQLDKDDLESVGLVKFDFLGLKTLTVIDKALATINAERAAAGEPPVDLRILHRSADRGRVRTDLGQGFVDHGIVERTGLDSLAVAIGTSHGAFKFAKEPKLAFDRIEQIMKTCPGVPLVMHGSSSVPKEFIDLVNKYGGDMPNAMGVPEEQIAMAVRTYGVCKVNIDTDLRLAMTAKIREVFATKPAEFDPRKYLGPARDAIRDMVKRKLHVLNSAGKADEVIKHWKKQGEPLPAYYGKQTAGV